MTHITQISGFHARLRSNVARRNSGRVYVARRALDTKTLRDAYKLRYDSYLASDYIDPRPDGLYSDEYDSLPTSHTAVIYDDARPVASVRMCFLSHDSLGAAPAGKMYPEEVGYLLASTPRRHGRPQACEISRLVRSPESENNQGLVFLLLRVGGYIAILEDVPLLLSSVRQNHVPLYRRMGNHVMSESRPYPGLKFATQLLVCSRENHEEACATFPIIDPFAEPSDSFDGFMEGRSVSITLSSDLE